MKVYADYNGEVPAGVVVVKEGSITRIYFDYGTETKQVDGEDVTMLVCENVDITGPVDYNKVVSAVVRDKYSADSVEAILSNGADTPEHKTEFDAFQEWRKIAKAVANAAVNPVV